jgi:RimJ/RimL family protein N-acetyltransferase
MPNLRLFTDCLELVAGTLELARAEIEDRKELARLLKVPQPLSWPPPLNDENSQKWFLSALEQAGPEDAGWNLWFCVRRDQRELVGNAGFKGSPKNGSVEIGYSTLEAHQRNGYCTEAVRALMAWAFEHEAVQTIIAHTLPALVPSIRVLEKCGFVFAGEGEIEDGMQTIRYELSKKAFIGAGVRTR